MKIINPDAITVKRALCPFCSYGCELGVVFDDFGIKGVEYISEGTSEGRLCPRGSASALYLNHPRRLTIPMKNDLPVDWLKIASELKKVVDKPKSVAVTFDRNITLQEYASIVAFCNEVGIENIASTYFEPEIFLKKFIDLKNPCSLEEIDSAETIIILGDPFNFSPMVSKHVIGWKLRDRKNRLIVIDSINTHTAAFASDFLRVQLGTEPILLFALAKEGVWDIDVSAVTGIDALKIEEISQIIKRAKKGVIIACLSFAHTYDPLLTVEGLTRLSNSMGQRVMPFFEFAGFVGKRHFGSILELAKKKNIKYLINFGELFPFYYPQITKQLKGVNIYACSTFKHMDFNATLIPFSLNLEKKGTFITTFGEKNLTGNIEPTSGTKSVTGIIDSLSKGAAKLAKLSEPEIDIDAKERMQKLVTKCTTRKKNTFKLMGEKIAYNFFAFFENDMLKMNPKDAELLGVKSNDVVTIESKQGRSDLAVKLTNDVDCGILVVPAETISTRGMFEFEVDHGIINFIPTEVKIWKKE